MTESINNCQMCGRALRVCKGTNFGNLFNLDVCVLSVFQPLSQTWCAADDGNQFDV